DVGLALGRVLAHELGHVLLATRSHQARGLMRPTFSGEELLTGVRERYGLSEPEVVRLRREIRRHNEVQWSECGWNISGTDCHQHAGGTGSIDWASPRGAPL